MSFNAYNQNSISTAATDTFRTTVNSYQMNFAGLRPKTKHRMYLDDTDYTWACRGYGQNLGEEIMSDENGVVSVKVLYEIPYSMASRHEFPEKNSISDGTNNIGRQNYRKESRIYNDFKTWTLRSNDGLSTAYYQMQFHIALVDGDYNRSEQHD